MSNLHPKIITTALIIALATATAAHAQGPGGRGHGGKRGSGSPPPATAATASPSPRQVRLNQIQITGVVQAIDLAAERITIAYEAVEALNWPAGAMPFAMGKSGQLTTIKVGQKVCFRIENQHIVDLKPLDETQPSGSTGDPEPSKPPS